MAEQDRPVTPEEWRRYFRELRERDAASLIEKRPDPADDERAAHTD